MSFVTYEKVCDPVVSEIAVVSSSIAITRPPPAPWSVMPDTVTPEVQLTPDEQAGMMTVPPAVAELMAVCTSLELQEAAVTV
jgi:hypothetical protein